MDGPFGAGKARRAEGAIERGAGPADHADAALHDVGGPVGEGKARRAQVADDGRQEHVDRGKADAELVHSARDGAAGVLECPAGGRSGAAAERTSAEVISKELKVCSVSPEFGT